MAPRPLISIRSSPFYPVTEGLDSLRYVFDDRDVSHQLIAGGGICDRHAVEEFVASNADLCAMVDQVLDTISPNGVVRTARWT